MQELLGDKHSKTTEIYIFVSRKFLEVVGKPVLTDNQALVILGNKKEIIE